MCFKKDRHCTYKRSTETRSRNHCCRTKVARITYSGCMFVALVTQDAMRMRHIAICGPSGTTVLFHIIS
jgi:hypothetical protein